MDRLIYSSKRIDDTDTQGYSPQFTAIGEVAASRNLELGITGYLICTPNWFAQVLEGENKELKDLMAMITRDKRHFDLRVLLHENKIHLTFPKWGMAWHHQTISNRILFLEHGLVHEEPPVDSDASAILNLARELAKNQIGRVVPTAAFEHGGRWI